MQVHAPIGLLLLAAHFWGDFVAQNDTMAAGKNPYKPIPLHAHVPWYYWMTAHAATHGAVVGLLLNNPILGVAEFVAHFWIDFAKCAGKISIHVDQALHVACKLLWLWLLSRGVGS